MRIAERARPADARLIHFENAQQIRDEIARAVPAYDGIQNLREAGDQLQWGGPRLCETREASGQTLPHFPTPSGRAIFSAIAITDAPSDGRLRLATRRGKQFNSIVQRRRDPLTGALREDVLMNSDDAARRGIADGDAVIIESQAGQMRGRCRLAPIAAGNVQVHWPEGNGLLARGVCDAESGIPDYNAEVVVRRAEEISKDQPSGR